MKSSDRAWSGVQPCGASGPPAQRRDVRSEGCPVALMSARRDNARAGEVAEWLNAAVLKTVDPQGFGGSNPSLSANLSARNEQQRGFQRHPVQPTHAYPRIGP